MANWVDKTIEYLSPGWALDRQEARTRLQMSRQFNASDRDDRIRGSWGLGVDDTTPKEYELSTLRERSRHANRNNPIAAGLKDTFGVNIIGHGLSPQSKVRGDALGVGDNEVKRIQKSAENAFSLWTKESDAANRLSFAEQQFLTFTKIVEDGESLIIPTFVEEPWRHYGRALEIIESDRLRKKNGDSTIDGSGIRFGKRGEPKVYYITKLDHTTGRSTNEFFEIPARDKDGRPNVMHVFPAKRAGQKRGIPFFAPIINPLQDIADYLEAEVVSARVSACLSVFITNNEPQVTSVRHSDGVDANNRRIQSLEPGMLSYLSPGEGINVVDPSRPGDTFGIFLEQILRHIGVALGMPYEVIAKDFSKTNYSSARASLLEARRVFTYWRKWFVEKLCQPVYELVLEEAYLRGYFEVNDFYENKDEYCRAMWIGQGWGWVDPVKEIKAIGTALDLGITTLAKEASANGDDWEENLDQRKKEIDKALDSGLVSKNEEEDNKSDIDEAVESKVNSYIER